MLSKECQQFMENLRKNYVPIIDYKNLDIRTMREIFDRNIESSPLPSGVTYVEEKINNITVEKIMPDGSSGKVIMHIHGGAMMLGNHSCARFMLSHLARLTNRTTYSLDYRLSPEFSQPAAIEDCVTVYKGLLKKGYQANQIVVIGESAGGALAMSLCAYLKIHQLPMPAAVCSISGSVDAHYESQSMIENIESEIVVNRNLIELMQAIYFKDCDSNDPILSPIKSDVTDWPPVLFHACKEEILRDESVRMYQKLQKAGIETELIIKEGLFHTYMMYNLPESFEAYEEIANFFNKY